MAAYLCTASVCGLHTSCRASWRSCRATPTVFFIVKSVNKGETEVCMRAISTKRRTLNIIERGSRNQVSAPVNPCSAKLREPRKRSGWTWLEGSWDLERRATSDVGLDKAHEKHAQNRRDLQKLGLEKGQEPEVDEDEHGVLRYIAEMEAPHVLSASCGDLPRKSHESLNTTATAPWFASQACRFSKW